MSITTEVRKDLIALVVGVYQAAPGTTLLSFLANTYTSNPSLAAVALSLQTGAPFIAAYPTFMTNVEFATRVVNNILADRVPATERTWAIDTLVASLNSGAGRAELILTAVIELQKTTNPVWANAKAAFVNKVDVATYHTVTMQKDGTLAERVAVVANVDQTAASVETAKVAQGGQAATDAAETVTLTTSVQALKTGSGNDTFNATGTGVLNAGDSIDGGAGRDTLNITMTAGSNNSLKDVTVKNVEVVNLTGANSLGTTTTTSTTSTPAANAGKAQVAVLDLTAARPQAEVQKLDFAGVTVSTSGNITVAGVTVALTAGDGPGAIAAKVKTALEANTAFKLNFNSITVTGSELTVNYKDALAATPTTLFNPDNTLLNATTDAANSPVTVAGTLPTTVVATAQSDTPTVSVSINGQIYTSAAVTTTGNQLGTVVAAPTPPTVTTVQGLAAVAGVTESNVVTFKALATGESVTVGGATVTATGAMNAGQVAAVFASKTAGAFLTGTALATTSGALTGFGTGTATGADVTFTSSTATTNVTDIASSSTATVSNAPGVVTTGGVAAVNEVAGFTFINITAAAGGTAIITIAGRSVTVSAGATVAAADIAAAFATGATTAANLAVGGQITGFTAAAGAGALVNFTSTTAATNVADLAAVVTAGAGGTAPATVNPAITQGVAPVTESSAVTFKALATGEAVTAAGATVTATAAMTAAEVAAVFASKAASAGLVATAKANVSGVVTAFSTGTATDAAVTFTSATAASDVTDIAVTTTSKLASVPGVVITQGVTAVAGVTEASTLTFGALAVGQIATVAGRSVTAVAAATAAEVASAVLAGTSTDKLTIGGTLANFTIAAVASDTTKLLFTSATAITNVADIVVSTAGSAQGAAEATALGNTKTAVSNLITQVLGDTVTVSNNDDLNEIKLTSKLVGVELPTVTVSQGTTTRSVVDAADPFVVANVAKTGVQGAISQVVTLTVGANVTASELFIDGVKYPVAAGNADATATALAASINSILGKNAAGANVASATGAVVTITAPVAGTPLPHITANRTGGTNEIVSAQVVENQKPITNVVTTTTTTTAAAVSGASFEGSEQIWLVGADSSKTAVTVTTQAAGLKSVTGLDNKITFGTAGTLAVDASTGKVDIAGAAGGLTIAGTTGTLELTNVGGTTAATGVKTLTVDMSGTSSLNVAGLGQLTSVTSTGAGGVTVAGATNKVASITTGAGADRVAINTATAKDDAATTTVNETVNAAVSAGDGADVVRVATTGAGTTTVGTGAGNDTIYVQGVSSGVASIAAGEGNDTVFLNTALSTNPSLTIDGGAGTDALVMAGSTLSAVDYLRMNAALSNFEAVRFTSAANVDASKLAIGTIGSYTFNAGANTITEVAQALILAPAAAVTASTDGIVPASALAGGASGLTASAAGYKVGVAPVATVYGGALNVTSATLVAPVTLSLKGSAATVTVAATGGAATASFASSATLDNSDLQSATINLSSARGTGTNAANEYLATVNVGTITTTNLQALSSLKVNGTGAFTVNTGAIATADVKLTTIDVSGMNAFADWTILGVPETAFLNRSTTSITLNNNVAETVILGGAQDTVITGSTVAAMDTITGFQLTANATTATLVDTARSDKLDVANGLYVKFTTTATTLIAALTEAGDSALGANLVFHFGGDTYVYSDTGVAGLNDTDGLVKLTGLLNLDLLVLGSANQTGVLI